MRNLSSTFRHEMYYNSHDYDHKAIITLADNSVLTLTNTELWAGGFSTDDAVSEDNSFTALGSTIIGAAKVIINNINQTYSDYDFTNATVELSLSKTYMLDDVATKESIRIGRYTVDECVYNGGTITLSVLDNMEKFDRPYSLSTLIYPATLYDIVEDACDSCGVTLATLNFPHYTYSISNRPIDEAITFRQVLGWVATIAGCFARCNSNGELELKWFDTALLASINEGLDGGVFDSATPYASGDNADGGSFNPWNTGYNYDEGTFSNRNNLHYISRLYSQNIGVDDIVITGINIIIEEADADNNRKNKEYTFGQKGYTIKIEGNKLITATNVNEIGTWLAIAIVGMRFRNVNVTHIDDPSIEAGDIGLVIDRKQNEYPILITRTSYSAGGSQTTVCGAESPSRNSATRYSQATQAYVEARSLLNGERSARERAVQDLTDRLAEQTGLYSTQEVTQSGTIYYLHDKPLLADSMIVWKMTTEAWGVSTDGGETWNAGMTVNGDVIARILNAIGVNADWIRTGDFKIESLGTLEVPTYTVFSANANTKQIYICAKDADTGDIKFLFDSSTGEVIINASQFSLSGTSFNDAVDNRITPIVDTTVGDAVEAAISDIDQQTIYDMLTGGDNNQGVYLYNGKLYLNWQYAHGQVLKLGSDDLFSSVVSYLLYKYNGRTMGTWTQNGVVLYKYDNTATEGPIRYRTWLDGSAIFGSYATYTEAEDAWLGAGMLNFCVWDSTYNLSYFDIVKGANNEAIRLHGPVIISNASFNGLTSVSSTSSTFKGYAAFEENLLNPSAPWTLCYTNVSPSSKRYKVVTRLVTEKDIQEAYKIKVYMARYKEGVLKDDDERYNKTYPMFIAEQIDQHLSIIVDHNADGTAETWNDRVIIPIMFQMIKDQKTQLDNQKEIIDKQQKEIDELKERLNKIESLLTNI